MRFASTFLFTALLAFSPAEHARGQTADAPVLETVSFRLNPGVTDQAFLAAAQATQAALTVQSGYVSRQLLRDDAGRWTDLVSWKSLWHAKTAATVLEQDPMFQSFVGKIDLNTLQMAHTPILWQIGG